MINELLDGCGEFFKEYCLKVYGEKYDEASWNYELYFYNLAEDEIELLENPFGIY